MTGTPLMYVLALIAFLCFGWVIFIFFAPNSNQSKDRQNATSNLPANRHISTTTSCLRDGQEYQAAQATGNLLHWRK